MNNPKSVIVNKPESFAKHQFVHPIKVAWGDMDSMRHLNNTKYFYFCETARFEFFVGLVADLDKSAGDSLLNGMALAETACRFKVSVTYPDELLIATEVESIDDTEFQLKHLIYSTKLDLIAAQASARIVSFDQKLGKRVSMSEQLVTRLKEQIF